MKSYLSSVAFVVDVFPHTTNPFIIHQIAGLKRHGISVPIYSFLRGNEENVSREYFMRDMGRGVRFFQVPKRAVGRLIAGIRSLIVLSQVNPRAAVRSLNVIKYGRDALLLRAARWAMFFHGLDADLVHCHFGPSARKFAIARDVLRLPQRFVTTFYGYDASRVFHERGERFYDILRRDCVTFIAMSENMKDRLVEHDFDASRIIVNPPGIDVDSHLWHERSMGVPVKLISVGRLVGKKGYDDLLKALAIVKKSLPTPIRCTIIGDGPLRTDLVEEAEYLGVANEVEFTGYLPLEAVDNRLRDSHIYVQPSKIDGRGNME